MNYDYLKYYAPKLSFQIMHAEIFIFYQPSLSVLLAVEFDVVEMTSCVVGREEMFWGLLAVEVDVVGMTRCGVGVDILSVTG